MFDCIVKDSTQNTHRYCTFGNIPVSILGGVVRQELLWTWRRRQSGEEGSHFPYIIYPFHYRFCFSMIAIVAIALSTYSRLHVVSALHLTYIAYMDNRTITWFEVWVVDTVYTPFVKDSFNQVQEFSTCASL